MPATKKALAELKARLQQEAIDRKEPHCLLFYANWCGHCVRFKPDWEELKIMKELDELVHFREFESDEFGSARMALGPIVEEVRSFPTIMFYINDKFIPFNEQRDINTLAKAIKRNSRLSEVKKMAIVLDAKAVAKPKAAGDKPKAAGVKPKAASDKPKVASVKPKVANVKPKAASDKPKAAKSKPTAAKKPKAASDKPKAAGDKPKAKAKAVMRGGGCGCAGMAEPPPS